MGKRIGFGAWCVACVMMLVTLWIAESNHILWSGYQNIPNEHNMSAFLVFFSSLSEICDHLNLHLPLQYLIYVGHHDEPNISYLYHSEIEGAKGRFTSNTIDRLSLQKSLMDIMLSIKQRIEELNSQKTLLGEFLFQLTPKWRPLCLVEECRAFHDIQRPALRSPTIMVWENF